MPTIDKIARFTITPEQFLTACSETELRELEMLLFSPRFQGKAVDYEEEMQKSGFKLNQINAKKIDQ